MTTESDLECLVYVSSAVRLLRQDEIKQLLAHARESNQSHRITGVLLYIDGNFMQYLEGPAAALDSTFERIQQDPLHSGIILMSRAPVPDRLFEDWSMAYQTRDLDTHIDQPGVQKKVEDHLILPEINPSNAQILLHGFWNRYPYSRPSNSDS